MSLKAIHKLALLATGSSWMLLSSKLAMDLEEYHHLVHATVLKVFSSYLFDHEFLSCSHGFSFPLDMLFFARTS